VQDRLTSELTVDKPTGDSADLTPSDFDRDLWPQLFGCDQIGEQREADAGALGVNQFVEQGKSVEPNPAGRKEIAALECGVRGLGYPECHTGAARLEHAERRTKRGTAQRVEDQLERPVRFGSGELAPQHDPFAAPFGDRSAIFLPTHMAPDLHARRHSELAGEMSDPTRGAVDQDLTPEQEPALAQRMQRGEARDRQRRRLGIPDRIRQRGDRVGAAIDPLRPAT
jgi:hypothetical protein